MHGWLDVSARLDPINPLGALSCAPVDVPRLALPQIPGALLARTNSENEARGSNKLLSAIEFGSVDEVRSVLAKVRSQDKSVLAAPSLVAEHGQRTPFMAAVARGDLSIFTALLHYFDRLFSDDVRTECCCEELFVF